MAGQGPPPGGTPMNQFPQYNPQFTTSATPALMQTPATAQRTPATSYGSMAQFGGYGPVRFVFASPLAEGLACLVATWRALPMLLVWLPIRTAPPARSDLLSSPVFVLRCLAPATCSFEIRRCLCQRFAETRMRSASTELNRFACRAQGGAAPSPVPFNLGVADSAKKPVGAPGGTPAMAAGRGTPAAGRGTAAQQQMQAGRGRGGRGGPAPSPGHPMAAHGNTPQHARTSEFMPASKRRRTRADKDGIQLMAKVRRRPLPTPENAPPFPLSRHHRLTGRSPHSPLLQLAETIPESAVYGKLLELERRIDGAVERRKVGATCVHLLNHFFSFLNPPEPLARALPSCEARCDPACAAGSAALIINRSCR